MPLFKILNFGLFQAAWFTAAWMLDDAIWIMLGMIVLHFLVSPSKREDIRLLVLLLPIGLSLEFMMAWLGFITFNSAFVLPIWMMLLWCLLILSFNHSLKWFGEIPLALQVVMSGVAGLASYIAAQKFQALSLGEPIVLYGTAIALVWAIQLPVMMAITKTINTKDRSCDNH